MADNDAASKTEEPTPHKLAEARKKGEVAKSQDLASFFALAGCFSVLAIGGSWLAQDLSMHLLPFIERPDQITLDSGGAVMVGRLAMQAAAPVLIAVMAGTAFFGAAGNLIQHGFMFTPSKLAPDFKKVSPMQGFQRLFGVDGLVQFLKSLIKVAAMSAIAWWALSPYADDLAGLAAAHPLASLEFSFDMLKRLFYAALGLFLVMGGLDWFWQRQRFMSKMRMTKEELKEDYKQSEGDPHVRAKQKQIRFERAKRRMMQNVPKATVVVMNPTHYAVALRYEPGVTDAPECVAKGLDSLALKIREIAEENGVPVVEDPPLARALYAAVEVDQTIPRQHYEAVAKVIGFVMGQAKKRAGRGRL